MKHQARVLFVLFDGWDCENSVTLGVFPSREEAERARKRYLDKKSHYNPEDMYIIPFALGILYFEGQYEPR